MGAPFAGVNMNYYELYGVDAMRPYVKLLWLLVSILEHVFVRPHHSTSYAAYCYNVGLSRP